MCGATEPRFPLSVVSLSITVVGSRFSAGHTTLELIVVARK